jgi:hypothetical protein
VAHTHHLNLLLTPQPLPQPVSDHLKMLASASAQRQSCRACNLAAFSSSPACAGTGRIVVVSRTQARCSSRVGATGRCHGVEALAADGGLALRHKLAAVAAALVLGCSSGAAQAIGPVSVKLEDMQVERVDCGGAWWRGSVECRRTCAHAPRARNARVDTPVSACRSSSFHSGHLVCWGRHLQW